MAKGELDIFGKKKYDIISLYSGGLDSSIATKMLTNMGLKVLAINFVLPFHGSVNKREHELHRFRKMKCDLLTYYTDEDYIEMMKKPAYGYGSNMNPCIDCKIYFLTIAREIMEYVGAKGVATGEVIGQRPMSQRKSAMAIIEKKAKLKGKLLRPLCAKFLPPTEIEESGLIDREQLLDIKGRGRKRQLELAKQLGITDYKSPAGGCLLTDPGYSFRLKESLGNDEDSLVHLHLLRLGRHFRLPEGSKLILGRDDEENHQLKKLFPDKWVKFDGIDVKGPFGGVRGLASLYELKLAASIWARYSQAKDRDTIEMRLIYPHNKKQILITHPIKEGEERQYLISPEDQHE